MVLIFKLSAGLSSLGVPGVPWHTQFLADQLTLFQPWGTDYAHLITIGTPGFSDLLMALSITSNALMYLDCSSQDLYIMNLSKIVELTSKKPGAHRSSNLMSSFLNQDWS